MKKQWTTKEITRLCQLYPRSRGSLEADFPGRSTYSIRCKAQQLGLRRGALFLSPVAKMRRSKWAAVAEKYEPVIFGGEL